MSEAATRAFLPPPIRERVRGWSRCVISGAELCGDPLLECLRLDGERWFGTESALTYASSLPASVELASRARARARVRGELDVDLALVAAPLHGPGIAELHPAARPIELSPAERRGLIGSVAPSRVLERFGADATLEALQLPQVRDARVLAVLAHGVVGVAAADGRSACLVLAPTASGAGLASCGDLERSQLPPVVELLACGGARGPLRLGDDGAAHLAGACFVAGAHCVLAARGDLPRAAAVDLARVVHERMLVHGDDPAEALRRARAGIAAEAATSDPWHWAALSAFGAAWLPVRERLR